MTLFLRIRAETVSKEAAQTLSPLDLEVEADLQALVARLGVDHYGYHQRLVPGDSDVDLACYTSFPEAWARRYWFERWIDVDPVMRQAQFHIMPIDWDTVPRETTRTQQLFQERAKQGFGPRGLTVPIRGAQGDFALLTVTSRMAIEPWREALPELARELVVAGYAIHEKGIAARLSDLATDEGRRLSPRERQVLTLAAQGKSHKLVAFSLALSESAVKLYLDSARDKLGASNTTNAVAHAVSRHLIPPPA